MGVGDGFRVSGLVLAFGGSLFLVAGLAATVYGFRAGDHESGKPAELEDPRTLDAAEGLVQGGVAAVFLGVLMLIGGPVAYRQGRDLANEAIERRHDAPAEDVAPPAVRFLVVNGARPLFWVALILAGLLVGAGLGGSLVPLDPTGTYAADEPPTRPRERSHSPRQDDTRPLTIQALYQGGAPVGQPVPEASFLVQGGVDRITLNVSWTKSDDPAQPGGVDEMRVTVVRVKDGVETRLNVLVGRAPVISFSVSDAQAGVALGGSTIRARLEPLEEGLVNQALSVNLRGWDDA